MTKLFKLIAEAGASAAGSRRHTMPGWPVRRRPRADGARQRAARSGPPNLVYILNILTGMGGKKRRCPSRL